MHGGGGGLDLQTPPQVGLHHVWVPDIFFFFSLPSPPHRFFGAFHANTKEGIKERMKE